MTTDKKLIVATYSLALIPLIVGLSIFFSWWIGKVYFLATLNKLEYYGFLWTLISIPVALVGLSTGLISFSKYRVNLKTGLPPLFCIFLNIPTLVWVLDKQSDIEKRAYVRVYNKTGVDFKSMTIKNSLFTESISGIENTDYETGYFYPNYDEFDSNAPEIEEVIIAIKTDKEEKRIIAPAIYKGECLKVFIDKRFKVEVKGRWYD